MTRDNAISRIGARLHLRYDDAVVKAQNEAQKVGAVFGLGPAPDFSKQAAELFDSELVKFVFDRVVERIKGYE